MFATIGIKSNTSEITNRNHAVPNENIRKMLVTFAGHVSKSLIRPSMPATVHCTDVDAFKVTTHYNPSVLGSS